MQTYLDAYIGRLRKEFEAQVGARCVLDFPDVLKNFCTRTPYLAVGPRPVQGSEIELAFFRDIHPFVEPQRFTTPPIAITIETETVDIFRNSDVSASVGEVAARDIAVARAAYVDFPHGSFPVDEAMQIRAVLAVPEAGGLRFIAAIGLRGSNKARHFSWRAGHDAVTGGPEVNACVTESPSLIHLGISVTECEPIETLLGGRPRRIRRLLRQIETVMLLAVAQFRSTLDAGDDAALGGLPHVGLTDPRRRSGNRKKTERENSFFRIRRLPHLRGVTVQTANHSWQQAPVDNGTVVRRRLQQVRGFFRMQPYGEGRSLRRLIWVPPFTRWVLDDGRVEMLALANPALVPELDDLLGLAEPDRNMDGTPPTDQREKPV